MKVARTLFGRTPAHSLSAFALGVAALAGFAAPSQANAQAPYLLPQTISSLGYGGVAPTIGQTCTGTNGVVGTAYDALGDGCPITSGNVIIGATSDIHDVGVDPQGNIFFLDNQGNGFLRRIDARSGIVTAYAGTAASSQPTVNCGLPTPTQDKYGDGCPANDGKANTPVSGGTYMYTANLAKARGIAVGRNGDVFLATYNGDLIQRVTFSTGTLNIAAGLIAGGTTAAPKGNIGQAGYTGDGGTAAGLSGAKVNVPRGVAVDTAGNVYIADTGNNVIRKVTAATGIITTIVGTSPGGGAIAPAGFAGDGGPATSAQISAPEDIEVSTAGDIIISDTANARIRIVYEGGAAAAKLISLTYGGTPTIGNIYTVAGGGAGTFSQTAYVLANSVPVGNPRKIALDTRGNIYIADNANNVIEFIDASTGYMHVIAGEFGLATGSGTPCSGKTDSLGDNCPATQATLLNNAAMGVGVDYQGNIYISDSGDKALRRVSTNQLFAATASGATLSQILVVHFAAGDAPAAVAPYTLTGSSDFTVTGSTCVVNPDTTQDCSVTVAFTPTQPGSESANLVVKSTVNGSTTLGISGTGTAASVALDPGATASLATGLTAPQGIAQDLAGNVYIADTGKNRILKVTGGVSTVFTGNGTASYTGDNGLAAAATLSGPKAVAVARDGSIVIADTGNNVIRSVSPVTGVITTIGGNGTPCTNADDTFGDGCSALNSTFKQPSGLAADPDGNIYVSDTGNNVVREITLYGYSIYIAGGATAACSGGDTFGNGCTGSGVLFSAPTGLAVDANRNLYIADTGNNEVRKIGASGIVTAVAGTGAAGASGNGGAATGAQLSAPTGVAVDAAGNVYIADTGNAVVRLVSGGNINTTVGTLGAPGTGTLPGSAFAVQLTNPAGVTSNGQGTLAVLDSGNGRAITDARGSVTYNFGRTNLTFSSPTLQIQETSTGSASATTGSQLFTTSGSTTSFTVAGSGSNGCSPNETLANGASCLLTAQFTPLALGTVTATYTESNTNTINNPKPFITVTGTGAVLTQTTSVTKVTTPATGSPTYAVPFVVTTTVTPASCNTAAPSCFPTGTVTFFVDGTQVGLPVALSATATASQTISGLSVGTHSVVAVYNGDSFYASSTAPALSVVIAQGITITVVTATPASSPQFSNLVLTASVTGPIATSFPTGSVSFYAGTTLLGTVSVSPTNGIATLKDVDIPATANTTEITPKSFNLIAGTYALTAVYSGDINYARSTSASTSLTITPDAPAISMSLLPAATGTAQGSTGQTLLTLTPQNTVNGTVTFSCTGLPANSTCTFQPTSITFTPVTGPPVAQQVQITLFTDVPPNAQSSIMGAPSLFGHSGESSLAGLVGWPVLLTSLFGLFGFRKQLRKARILTLIALFGLLAGGSAVLSGCSTSGTSGTNLTPVGTYTVTVHVTGSNAPAVTAPITFTVTAGVPGQL